ncbi:MAG: ABC transporter ATP-binding protein [Methanomassiliicoccaceae archaeon]|nr:ABC transporter ATP-binding protein [Methanomassiliicoccaceae archaeon]
MTNAIDITMLTKSFGNFTAVHNVSMTVKRGEYMGLLGPNGAGKSTILKVITGMISPSTGSITINGIDHKDHRKAMESVGCVIETPECYPNFTPTEMLNYVGKIKGIRRANLNPRIREVLEEVRMWEWKDKPIGKFSKGMKQRVSLATALMSDPDILLMDEPTSGLDPRGMIEVREILSGLKREGRSLLISTHMLNEVSEVCDSVTVIRRGQMMMSGNVRELLRKNVGDVTIEVAVKKNITQEFMNDIAGSDYVANAKRVDDYAFTVSFAGGEDREGIVDIVKQHELGLLTLNQKGSDLESLYMSLTQEGDRDDIR